MNYFILAKTKQIEYLEMAIPSEVHVVHVCEEQFDVLII